MVAPRVVSTTMRSEVGGASSRVEGRVVPLRELRIAIRGALAEWLRLRWNDEHFAEVSTALFLLVVLFTISLLMFLVRGLRSRQAGRTHVALPAILPVMQGSSLSAIRHAAFVVFLLGVPFFAMALADPRIALVSEEVTHLGRRIAILIDGSGSIVLPFDSPRLRPEFNRTFYTAVAAAEHFLKLRMNGSHGDLIALVQFGSEAYVVTPFTTDYENVLLSTKLIGDPSAWNRFNVFGTTIIQGIEQGLQLFKTFDLLNASGNLIVIFSDGNDGETTLRGRTLDDLMAEAREHEIPIYMVRLGFNKKLGDVTWDGLWKSAVERTGGRFYAAADENTILRAVSEIDRLSAGSITVRRYSSARPGFSGYALIAVALWLIAAVLKLGFRCLRTFP